jgi:hypothetical protein
MWLSNMYFQTLGYTYFTLENAGYREGCMCYLKAAFLSGHLAWVVENYVSDVELKTAFKLWIEELVSLHPNLYSFNQVSHGNCGALHAKYVERRYPLVWMHHSTAVRLNAYTATMVDQTVFNQNLQEFLSYRHGHAPFNVFRVIDDCLADRYKSLNSLQINMTRWLIEAYQAGRESNRLAADPKHTYELAVCTKLFVNGIPANIEKLLDKPALSRHYRAILSRIIQYKS